MFFAAEKAPGGLDRFAARKVDAAMRTGNHRLTGGRPGVLAALARQALHDKENDDDGENQKEELAQTELPSRATQAAFASRAVLSLQLVALDRRIFSPLTRDCTGARTATGPHGKLVGVTGFEPATPASRTQYSTRLSYTPGGQEPARKAIRED